MPGVARALLWVSLTTSVVILVAWIASGWWGLCFNCRGIFVVEVERGCVTLLNDLENVRGYWGEDVWCHIRRADGFSLRWTPPHTASCAQSTYGTWGEINVPFWVLFLGAGVPVFLAIRSRRHPSGHCQRCGYDLTGNVSGRCPECGAVVRNEGGVEAEDRVGDT